MAQNSKINVQFFASGYCLAHAKVVNPIEGVGRSKFYAVWALIHIAEVGYILFDTGYSKEFLLATKALPERIYRWVTPVALKEVDSAKSLLERQNINAADIKYVIISHFHADHISGLKDFPNAELICSKDAYGTVINSKGINAVRKGILHNLLPLDFYTRVKFIEDFADTILINEFGITEYGVFGIKNWKLILLPGHAKGMLGFILHTDKESLLYATDASWSYDVYKKGILPKKVVKLFFDSWNEFIDTQQKLKALELKNVNYKILFTHCPQTLKFVCNEI